MAQRSLEHKAITMYKIANGSAPSYLINSFSFKMMNHDLRSGGRSFLLPKTKTKYFHNSFDIWPTDLEKFAIISQSKYVLGNIQKRFERCGPLQQQQLSIIINFI